MKKLIAGSTALLVLLAAAALLLFRGASPGQSCRAAASWGAESGLKLEHPMAIGWGGGLLYVADAEHGSIKVVDGEGSLIDEWPGFSRPVAVAPAGGAVYVADFLADQVVHLDADGKEIRRWGRQGRGAAEFDAPSGIAVDGRGQVYVADFYNHRIQRFTAEGRFLGEWGKRGVWKGRFRYPAGIALARSGEVLVADAFNHRVQVFTPEGRHLRTWGGLKLGLGGGRPGWFRLAKEVALGPGGSVYVADAFNGRVQKFAARGALLAVWKVARRGDPPTGERPAGLSRGDPASGVARRDRAARREVEAQASRPSGKSSVRRPPYPAGVAVDSAGDVYVSDFFQNRIWKLHCG